jgi:predicted extracellular nuclease
VAGLLESMEGMLVEFPAGMRFIAPSNPFGDYVLTFDAAGESEVRTPEGGVLISPSNPNRWYPGFRVYDYRHARQVNVGARLNSAVRGALHYRVDAWQVATNFPFKFSQNEIAASASSLRPGSDALTVMTLNCFNLDSHVESADRVVNPSQDVDDDWGEGRFHSLARAVVQQAHCPDIIALQEIQDNDGAEQTNVTDADDTYRLLVRTIEGFSGVRYQWVDIDPQLGADGGQPGGNIRNGFLYNSERVRLIPDSVIALGKDEPAFEDSRKPLVARFKERGSGKELVCINIHLASKRHQNSIFAPVEPGVDRKLAIRVAQARIITEYAEQQLKSGYEVYITGDFNDTEHSETLRVMTQGNLRNLVLMLPNYERYDYNHRGKLQVLMHGLVSQRLAAERAEYEIIHGNELIGVQPGEVSNKASDHAYVIARLQLSD